MDRQTLWGLLFIVYIIPFWLWQVSEQSTLEARRKLYPEGPDQASREGHFNAISLIWCMGLIAALAAWWTDWYPIPTAVLLLGTLLAAIGGRAGIRRWNLLANQWFRSWLAGSAVWCVAVSGWFLVLGRFSELENHECLLLALTPPLVAGFALVAWWWALRNR